MRSERRWTGVSFRTTLSFLTSGIILVIIAAVFVQPERVAAQSEADPTNGCYEYAPTIVGTPEDDVLVGTEAADVIQGLGGNDDIQGLGGNDIICGGDGNDTIAAGPGNDVVLAGPGDDQVSGGGGHDLIGGDAGNDVIHGGSGKDHLWGDSGGDVLHGDGGSNVLAGGEGDDQLHSGPGQDILNGTDDDLDGSEEFDICHGALDADSITNCDWISDDPEAPPAPASEPPIGVGEFRSAECQFEIPEGQDPQCGYLAVPEDHADPAGPTILLHMAIFPSPDHSPAPDPVVYLSGGPGENALDTLQFAFDQAFAHLLEERDVVVFDQRGTGHSRPALDCPELIEAGDQYLDQPLTMEESVAVAMEAFLACRDRLVEEGVDLSAFTSAQSAADVALLRQALGYPEWNLFGVSYGTRLAQTVMRDHPDGIRSVILDSAYPLEANLYTGLPANGQRALDLLFASCAQSPECHQAFPDLVAVLQDTVAALNETPATITITDPLTGEPSDYLVTGDGLVAFLFTSMYSAELIPVLPKLIYDANQGVFDTLALIQSNLLVSQEFVSLGAQLSVQCHEEVPFTTREEIMAAAEAHPLIGDFLRHTAQLGPDVVQLCEEWGVPPADPLENLPMESPISTIILAGEYDPVTPPDWGESAHQNLPNSFFFEYPGLAHGTTLSHPCPQQMELAFLGNPSQEPEATCIDEMAPPQFVVPVTEVNLVPFQNDAFGISGVIPEGWQETSPGVYTASPPITLIIQQAADVEQQALLREILAGLGIEEEPAVAGERQVEDLTWTLYELRIPGLVLDLALSHTGGRTFLILLQSQPAERMFYYTEVFLPAIEAFRPTE